MELMKQIRTRSACAYHPYAIIVIVNVTAKCCFNVNDAYTCTHCTVVSESFKNKIINYIPCSHVIIYLKI